MIFFFQKNFQKFFHVLKEYSYLLNENESKILSYLSKGLNQDKIADKLGVTHQAISFSVIKLQEKLNAFFNFKDIIQGDSNGSIQEGKNAMDNFFSKNVTPKITEEDRLKIRNLIINNPNKYTSAQINKILFNNKFLSRQITSSVAKTGLQNLIIRKLPYKFSIEERTQALDMFLCGSSTAEVALEMRIPLNVIRSLRGQFVKEKKLEPIRRRE